MPKEYSKKGNDAEQVQQSEDKPDNWEENSKPYDAEEGKRGFALDDKRLQDQAKRKSDQRSRNHEGYSGL